MTSQTNPNRLSRSFILAAIFVITGCATKPTTISFEIKMPGVADGTFVLKDSNGKVPYGGTIKNGNLKLNFQPIEQVGYYILKITDGSKKAQPAEFEVYLEPGNYTIETSAQTLGSYPKITSPSSIQKELSNYYIALDSALQGKPRVNANAIEESVLKAFVNKNPNNTIAPHIMLSLAYDSDPVGYYAIYKNINEAARNSFEGKEIGDILSHLVKLTPGQPAPLINGTTPAGGPFKVSDLNKKIYLIEFWKSANELSRINHGTVEMKNMLSQIPLNKHLGIIGISLDNKRDWWVSALHDDNVSYPQFSDLKGNESVNAVNWGIKRIPTYYLVDGNWKILEKDIR